MIWTLLELYKELPKVVEYLTNRVWNEDLENINALSRLVDQSFKC